MSELWRLPVLKGRLLPARAEWMTVVGSSVNCVVEGAGAFRPGELDTVYDIYVQR